MYSQHVNIVNFLTNFTFLTATYLSKTRYSLFVLKVPLNLSQSINYWCMLCMFLSSVQILHVQHWVY